jgi:hypothetical protein
LSQNTSAVAGNGDRPPPTSTRSRTPKTTLIVMVRELR